MFSRSNICQSCIYESDLFLYIFFLLRSKMQPSETTDNMIRLQEEHHEYSRVAQRRVQRHRDAHGFFSRHLCGLRLKRQHARSSGYTLTSALKLLGSRIASLCVCVCVWCTVYSLWGTQTIRVPSAYSVRINRQ